MKKVLIGILTVTMVLSMVGCTKEQPKEQSSSSSQESTSKTEENKEENSSSSETVSNKNENKTPVDTENLSENLLDFQISVDGKVLTLPTDVATLKGMGFEIEEKQKGNVLNPNYSTVVRLKRNNEQLVTSAYNLEKEIVSLEDAKISSISFYAKNLKESKIVLPKGITFESSVEDVINTYGEPTKKMNDGGSAFLTYEKDYKNYVKINFFNGKMTDIDITRKEV